MSERLRTLHAFKYFKYAYRYLAEAMWRFNRPFDLKVLVPRPLGGGRALPTVALTCTAGLRNLGSVLKIDANQVRVCAHEQASTLISTHREIMVTVLAITKTEPKTANNF